MNKPAPLKGGIWKSLTDVSRDCKVHIDAEINCDLMNGPEAEECQHLFLRNEDCFQKVLCHAKWTEALTCLKTSSREACERKIQLSRECKSEFFDRVLTPQMEKYLRTLGEIQNSCEEFSIRHQNCVSILGANDPECLARELVKMECLNSRVVPQELWMNWKACEKEAGGDAYDLCPDELDEIRLALATRSENLCLSIDGVKPSCFKEFGGPDGTLDMLSKVFYASHHRNLFKHYDPRNPCFRKPVVETISADNTTVTE